MVPVFLPRSHQWAPANKLSSISLGGGLCLTPNLQLCPFPCLYITVHGQCQEWDSESKRETIRAFLASSSWQAFTPVPQHNQLDAACTEFSPALYLLCTSPCTITYRVTDGIFASMDCFPLFVPQGFELFDWILWLQMKQREERKGLKLIFANELQLLLWGLG